MPLTRYNDGDDLCKLIPSSILTLLAERAPKFVDTLISVVMGKEGKFILGYGRPSSSHSFGGLGGVDVGQVPVLRFVDGSCLRGEKPVTQEEIQAIVDIAGDLGPEHSGVFRHSLHLCTTIQHPLTNQLTGLTVKVGRAIVGLADGMCCSVFSPLCSLI